MSERIDRNAFCKVYVPMARAKKSALEIGKALGVDKMEGKDTDAKVSQFVSQKASNYRKELKASAEAAAKKQELDAEATKALVEATTAKLPKLSVRNRTSGEDLASFLDSLLEECDAPPAEEGEGEESTETPS